MFLQYFTRNENKDKIIARNIFNNLILTSKIILKKLLLKKEISFNDSFELVSLLIICFFFSSKYNKNFDYIKLNQNIMNYFTSDLDHSMRLLGVSDMKISKHVKHYVKKFYHRLSILKEIFLKKKDVDFQNYLIKFNLIASNQDDINAKHFFNKLLIFIERIKNAEQSEDIELIFNEIFN